MKKQVALLYNSCCVYEIAALHYFMQCRSLDVIFCSVDGEPVRSMEGYPILVDMALHDLKEEEVESLVIPGGGIREIDTPKVWRFLERLRDRGCFLAAICAGVDVLDHAGILKDVRSTHSVDEDVVLDGDILTSRANGYIDFAIAGAQRLGLFESEADKKETVDFWKYHKRM